jgi:hypothetical protein
MKQSWSNYGVADRYLSLVLRGSSREDITTVIA